MCQDCLGIAKGAAASIWGKESTTVRSKHYISYLIFDGTTVHNKLTWQRKTQVSQRTVYDSGDQVLRDREDAPAE